jgi:hypothetical protein
MPDIEDMFADPEPLDENAPAVLEEMLEPQKTCAGRWTTGSQAWRNSVVSQFAFFLGCRVVFAAKQD